jgi:hypothetical protein
MVEATHNALNSAIPSRHKVDQSWSSSNPIIGPTQTTYGNCRIDENDNETYFFNSPEAETI